MAKHVTVKVAAAVVPVIAVLVAPAFLPLPEAHAWARELRDGASLIDIARETGRSKPYIRARLPLAFLAPRLQTAILEARQPIDLCVAQIIREDLPMDWAEQARILGIAESSAVMMFRPRHPI